MSKLITSKTLDASKLTPLGRKSTKPSPIRSATKPAQKAISKQASSKAFDSKTSTIDKSQRTDSSPWQTFQKLSTNLITESMLCGNLISEDNSLDFSSFNLYSSNLPKEQFKSINNKEEIPEDIEGLKKELHAKNQTIDQLKKENVTLRREIEEFITIADRIHRSLDQELKQYEAKIANLEQENSDLLAENKFYKEQTHNRFKQKRPSLNDLSIKGFSTPFENSHIDFPCDQSKNETEGFYIKVKEKLVTFLEDAKGQLEVSSKNNLSKNNGVTFTEPKETLSTSRQEREGNKTPQRVLSARKDLKRIMTPEPLKKILKNPLQNSARAITPSTTKSSTNREYDIKVSFDLMEKKRHRHTASMSGISKIPN